MQTMSSSDIRPVAGETPASASAGLQARARRVMPGGLTRSSVHWPGHQHYMVSGKGSRVIDADGVERIDVQNNYTSLLHGHAHPVVTERLVAQARRGTVFGAVTEPEVQLAELLCERVPSFERIRFCNSGTEATLNAVKAARAFTGRPMLAKAEGAYHGTSEFVDVSVNTGPANWGPAERPAAVAEAFGTPQAVLDTVLVIPYNDPQRALALLEAHRDELAGVMLDVMPMRCGLPQATAEYLRAIEDFCRRSGALLILDEVLNFRIGYAGAQGEFGVRPDLTAIGKVIGGGLPVGGVAGRAEVMQVFDSDRGHKVPHGGTFNGNPLTMAAGHAAMELMTPEAMTRLNALGERLRANVRAAIATAGAQVQVTGRGSLFRILPHTRPVTDFRSYYPRPGEGARTEWLMAYMLEHGFLVTRMGAGCLSTANTEAEVDRYAEVLLAGLRKLEHAGLAAVA